MHRHGVSRFAIHHLPQLTEQRRRELVKQSHKRVEEAKVANVERPDLPLRPNLFKASAKDPNIPLPDVLDFQGDALPAPPREIVAGLLAQVRR